MKRKLRCAAQEKFVGTFDENWKLRSKVWEKHEVSLGVTNQKLFTRKARTCNELGDGKPHMVIAQTCHERVKILVRILLLKNHISFPVSLKVGNIATSYSFGLLDRPHARLVLYYALMVWDFDPYKIELKMKTKCKIDIWEQLLTKTKSASLQRFQEFGFR